MVIILERDEAERLKYALRRLLRGAKNFRHSVYGARPRLKCNFDEVALPQRTRQLQQPAGYRDRLEFSFSVPAIF